MIDKVASQIAASFPINQIASDVQDALPRAPGWPELKACIASARSQTTTFWGGIDLPAVPSLEEIRRYARGAIGSRPPHWRTSPFAHGNGFWSWSMSGSARPHPLKDTASEAAPSGDMPAF